MKSFLFELLVFTACHPHPQESPKYLLAFCFSLSSFILFSLLSPLSCSLSFLPSSLACRNEPPNFFLPWTGFHMLRDFWSMKDLMVGGHLLIQGTCVKIILILVIVYPWHWRKQHPFWDLTSTPQKVTLLLWNSVESPKRVRKRQKLKQSSKTVNMLRRVGRERRKEIEQSWRQRDFGGKGKRGKSDGKDQERKGERWQHVGMGNECRGWRESKGVCVCAEGEIKRGSNRKKWSCLTYRDGKWHVCLNSGAAQPGCTLVSAFDQLHGRLVSDQKANEMIKQLKLQWA